MFSIRDCFASAQQTLRIRIPADPFEVHDMSGSDRAYIRSEVLNSWKEIAEYLDRGIRTVQRWERDLRLPVRRPRGRRRSAVLALPKELDAWLGCCPQISLPAEESSVPFNEATSLAGATASSPDLPGSEALGPESL